MDLVMFLESWYQGGHQDYMSYPSLVLLRHFQSCRTEEHVHQTEILEHFGEDLGDGRLVSEFDRKMMRDLGIHEDQVLILPKDCTIFSMYMAICARGSRT